MRRFIFCIILVIFTILLVGCGVSQTWKDKSNWPPDGLYFMQWDSYHGYFTDEDPYIQLSLVHVRSKSKVPPLQSTESYVLLSDQGEIVAESSNISPGTKGKQYTLYTLGLNLPKLSAGKYVINQLQIVESKQQKVTSPIGRWVIEVREGDKPKELSLGKTTLSSGIFDWYLAELINDSNNEVVIKKLDYQLEYNSHETVLKTFKDFNMQTRSDDKPFLSPDETKTFLFEFTNAQQPPKFVSLRPFLSYEIGDQLKFIALPTAIYSHVAKSDEEIKQLITELLNSNK
ncbi:MAG TPA: hypothetical protein GXX72_02450 [Clostridiaceae bacterium]|nr:hypothetical protein [Clostridiaceae bacterium]